MIGPERAGIFPLRVDSFVAFADRNPSAFAGRNRRTLIRFFEPWHHARRFRPMTVVGLVVVRKRAIKRILAWREIRGNKITPLRAVGVIEPAVASCPVRVPGAGAIWGWIVGRRSFANPENRGHDLRFPREVFSRFGDEGRIRLGRGGVRIDLEQRVGGWFARRFLAQLHEPAARPRGGRSRCEERGDRRK